MSSMMSIKPSRAQILYAFRGDIAALRPGRVQCRRLTPLQVVHAKKRSEEVEEKAAGGLQGLTNKVKTTFSSRGASPRGGAPRKQASGSQETSTTNKQEGFKIGTFSLGGPGSRRNDPNTVFVAGATGRLGCRVVLELLRNKKLRVRAGARNPQEGRDLVKAATDYGILTAEQARRLTVVPVDLEDEDSIAPAVGNAGRVVQAIGAAETKLLDFGAPSRIDGEAAIKLVNVSKDLGIKQYVMVTSLGTTKLGFPASLLNLFWGILTFKKKAEKALQASGIPFVIVRPGGMERPTDTYKRTHNVRLETRDQLFGGQVSRLQVAELIAAAVSNPEVAENKVLEVVAEETAAAMPYIDLLTAQPVDGQKAQPPQQASTPTLGTAKQQAGQNAQQAKQATSQAVSQAAPGKADAESPAEEFKEVVDSTKKTFFESAEELDKQRLEAQQRKDEELKQERAERAKKNAELLAQQKAEREVQAKKQAEEDKRKQDQKAKKDAEAKAAADKKKKTTDAKAAEDKKKKDAEDKKKKDAEDKKKKDAQAKAAEEKKKSESKPPPKAEPKKKIEGKDESSAAETSEAKEQAKRAAAASKEAREWINNWKDGKTSEPIQSQGRAKTPPPASSKTDQEAIDATTRQQKPQLDVGQQLTNVFSGLKLPWQGGNGANAKDQQAAPQQASQAAEKKPAAKSGPKVDATSAAGGSAETMGQRQEDVRKWINDWRAK